MADLTSINTINVYWILAVSSFIGGLAGQASGFVWAHFVEPRLHSLKDWLQDRTSVRKVKP